MTPAPPRTRATPPTLAAALRDVTIGQPGGVLLTRFDLELWWMEAVALLDLDDGAAAGAVLEVLVGRRAPAAGSVLVTPGADVRLGPGGARSRLAVVREVSLPRGSRRRAVVRATTDLQVAARADRVVVLRSGRAVAVVDEPCEPELRRVAGSSQERRHRPETPARRPGDRGAPRAGGTSAVPSPP